MAAQSSKSESQLELEKKLLKMPVWSGDLELSTETFDTIPNESEPNGLNMIVIIADTWRADHLGCYGSTRIKTPHLDKLARDSVIFTDATTEGLPTIPARRVYHTGKTVLPDAEWKPLAKGDPTFAEILKKHGFTCGLFVDTYHHFKPSYNFHRGFDTWQWVRGQECDGWKLPGKNKFDPKEHIPEHMWNPYYDRDMRQYMANTHGRESNEDYFCARTCNEAGKWLQENSSTSSPFMLWIDMFDPHEPWDAPKEFQQMYRKEYPFERYLFGYGVMNEDIKPEDIPVLKDLYAAEVTFSDYCIGKLLEKVEKLGLMDNTIIVFSTDHGTHLGEEGCVQKTPGLLNSCVTQLPLIIRHPEKKFHGKKIDSLVSALDYMPSFLAMLGIDDFKDVDGENMWDLVTGEKDQIHDFVYSVFDKFGAVHNLKWHYFQNIRGSDAGKGPCLYDLSNDPQQTKNVAADHPDVAKMLKGKLLDHLGIAE